jgi:hypothetical protein
MSPISQVNRGHSINARYSIFGTRSIVKMYLTSTADGVVDSRTISLIGIVTIAHNISRLTVRNGSTGGRSITTTGLNVADASSILLDCIVAIASDDRDLIVANRRCGIASMSGE